MKGYPTIKYSTGLSWEKYTKGRDYDSLLSFVEDELSDGCLDDEELCTEEELETLKEVRSLSTDAIEIRLEEIQHKKAGTETIFKEAVERIQKEYQALLETKEHAMKSLQTEQAFLKHVSSEKTEL